MIEMIEANWPLLLAAFLIGLALAFLLFRSTRKTRVTGETGDVLDEGASPAARNQALIDSGASAAVDPAPPAPEARAAEAVAPPQSAPAAAQPAASPAAPTDTSAHGAGDDLTRLKGVGPKLATKLGELGVTSYAQIAAWDDAEIDRIDAELGRFQGRIRRDDWVTQARLLDSDDQGAYEARFGKLD